MTKKAFKNALVKMLADGEFDKLVDAYPAKAGWILSLKASLAELEENHDGGIREFPIMGLIGGFIDEEPVLSDVLTYMLTEANRAERTCRNLMEPDEMYEHPFRCSECGCMGPYGEATCHVGGCEQTEDGPVFWDSWPAWSYCPHCGARVVSE